MDLVRKDNDTPTASLMGAYWLDSPAHGDGGACLWCEQVEAAEPRRIDSPALQPWTVAVRLVMLSTAAASIMAGMVAIALG
jgi:hypothetical protein